MNEVVDSTEQLVKDLLHGKTAVCIEVVELVFTAFTSRHVRSSGMFDVAGSEKLAVLAKYQAIHKLRIGLTGGDPLYTGFLN